MQIANLSILAKAVSTAYGSHILSPSKSAQARGIFCHAATAAGYSIVELRRALDDCQYGAIVNAALNCKRDLAAHDPETEVMLTRVEAILEILDRNKGQSMSHEGARAPTTMTAEFWDDIVTTLGRPLHQTDNGELECDFIAESYAQLADKMIPCDTEYSIVIPKIRSVDNEVLELSFRSLAIDGYGAGEDTTTWEVVLTASLTPDGKEAA